MTTEEVGCLRSDVGRQKAEVGTTELRRETNTNLTDDTNMQGRDTRMCGDPKTWFPMRVTYQREMKVKTELDRLGIENFVPMRYRIVERRVDGTTELRRETNTNLTDDTNIRDKGDWHCGGRRSSPFDRREGERKKRAEKLVRD